MSAFDKRDEITIAPASPQQTMPVTIGTYGAPENTQQSLPVFQPGPGYKGAPPALGADGKTPTAAVAPPVNGTAPQTVLPNTGIPKTGGTAPMNATATLLPEGVVPWGPGAAIKDPNNGRERLFATPTHAAEALAKLSVPAGHEQARGELIQYLSALADEGNPAVSPNYQIKPGEEGAHRLTQEEVGMLNEGRPGAIPPAPAASAVAGPGSKRTRSRARPEAGDIELIRGVQSQVIPGGAKNMSAEELYRVGLEKSIAANLTAGVPIQGSTYGKGGLRTPGLMEELQRVKGGAPAVLPDFKKVQGQRAQEILQHPELMNAADDLVFRKGAGNGQGGKTQLYKKPIYDQYGAQTGETPYLYDEQGNVRPLTLPDAGPSQGSAGQAPAAAVAKLKANPKLAPAFKQKYGYLPQGI